MNTSNAEAAPVIALYRQLHQAWNERSASDFAALFTDDGTSVGFDGSEMHGPAQIERELAQIFADHQTAAYVGIVREVRFLYDKVAVLRAAAGMIPPGSSQINPATNALQTLTVIRQGEQWRIAHFQNTPAQFHGRPALSEALTAELNQVVGV